MSHVHLFCQLGQTEPWRRTGWLAGATLMAAVIFESRMLCYVMELNWMEWKMPGKQVKRDDDDDDDYYYYYEFSL